MSSLNNTNKETACSTIKVKCVKLRGSTHIFGGGGGVPIDFFGSEILAKSDFLGSMKDAGIFLGREKKTDGFFWVAKKGLRVFWGVW